MRSSWRCGRKSWPSLTRARDGPPTSSAVSGGWWPRCCHRSWRRWTACRCRARQWPRCAALTDLPACPWMRCAKRARVCLPAAPLQPPSSTARSGRPPPPREGRTAECRREPPRRWPSSSRFWPSPRSSPSCGCEPHAARRVPSTASAPILCTPTPSTTPNPSRRDHRARRRPSPRCGRPPPPFSCYRQKRHPRCASAIVHASSSRSMCAGRASPARIPMLRTTPRAVHCSPPRPTSTRA